MTTLLPPAKSQFLDANGAPLAGGKVYFYVPGTTNFKTTWQDSGQVAANTNPIILDSAGEAVIFGSGTYRQVLFDSLGNQIWDQLTSSTDATGIALGGALQNYLSGLTLSNSSNTSLAVAAGICTDDTNSFLIGLLAGTIDCTTVGKNGLDAGALANTTWYHVFAIAQPSGFSPGFLASTSLNPTMPATYTLKRRIGSFETDSSAHIQPFVQFGNQFVYTRATLPLDINDAGVSTGGRTLVALSVPPGVQVTAIISATMLNAGVESYVGFSSAAEPDRAINRLVGNVDLAGGAAAGNNTAGGRFDILTNTSKQIGYRGAAGSGTIVLIAATRGYLDPRGTA